MNKEDSMTSVSPPLPEPADWVILTRRRAGVVGLIIAEASLLGVFVVAYLFYIGKSLSGPRPADVLALPVLNTLFLLASSVTVALAVRALRQGARSRAGAWFPLTALLGAAFLAGTSREWYRLIVEHGLTIGTNLFGTTFYSLVGFHALHVTVGVVILTLLSVCTWSGALRATHTEQAELVSWYWHFVDGVWIVVLMVVYVVGR
jgi:cytochrome c oxidase subunit 3/cytochrome o ubiquinol oxidase subunit 3